MDASNDHGIFAAADGPKPGDTVVRRGVIGAGWTCNAYETVGTAAVLTFDLPSQVTGRTITRATLRLTVTDPPTEFPAEPQLRLSAFASDWSRSAIAWNICAALAIHAAGEALVPAPTGNGPLDFDVAAILANRASGTWKKYGLRLMADQPAVGIPPHAPFALKQGRLLPFLILDELAPLLDLKGTTEDLTPLGQPACEPGGRLQDHN